MDKILDFNCTYNSVSGIDGQMAERLGLTFPDAYMHEESLVKIALAVKEQGQAPFCILPLCHTVEGAALGADINYGNGEIGPRAGKQICSSAEDFLALPDIDFTKGRIAEVLKACSSLRAQGEHVVLELSGPFTILDTLMDARIVFRTMRKQPELMEKVLEKLRRNILAYFREAANAGVDLISYADSSGGLNILGPKLAEQMAVQFTYPLLKEVTEVLDEKTLVLLCPKTSFALLGTGKGQWQELDLDGPMTYGQACIQSIGKLKFGGQMCIKNTGYILEKAKIKGIELL